MPVALIADGQVMEVFASRDAIADHFHPDILASLVEIPEHVGPGWHAADGLWRQTPPEAAPDANDYARAIQDHVDGVARVRGYADGNSIAGYVASTIPKWASEAASFIAWRDQVWIEAYGAFDAVQAGQRSAPNVKTLIKELPTPVFEQQLKTEG
ncbi:MAG TPA: hypothetical protein PLD46_04940 [Hyphomicrobium sp.]|nr:hypothetical protein [Hyphomicrobium sp.]